MNLPLGTLLGRWPSCIAILPVCLVQVIRDAHLPFRRTQRNSVAATGSAASPPFSDGEMVNLDMSWFLVQAPPFVCTNFWDSSALPCTNFWDTCMSWFLVHPVPVFGTGFCFSGSPKGLPSQRLKSCVGGSCM